MTSLRRLLVPGVFACLCAYVMLPFQTDVPGLSTFTILKAASAVLIVAAAFGRSRGEWQHMRRRMAGWLVPFVALAVWMPLAAAWHPAWGGLDAKMFLSLGAGVLLAVVLDRELAAVATRRTAVRVILWGGVIAAGFAVLEPVTTPAWDGFWRWFRPNLPVYNAVTGTVDELHWIHWNVGGLFRLSGIQDSPNGLAALLALWCPLAGAVLLPRGRGWAILTGSVMLVLAATMTRSLALAAAAGCAAVLLVACVDRFRQADRRNHARLLRDAALLAGGLLVLVMTALRAGGETTSEAALLGLAVFGGLVILHVRIDRRVRRRDPAAAGAFRSQAMVGVQVLAAILLLPFILPLLGARFDQTVEQASAERRQLWRAACHLIREAPVEGPGYHRYYDVIQHDPVYRVPSLIGDFGRAVDNPHNLFLTAAVAGGIPALGLLLAAAAVLIRMAARATRDRRGDPAARGLAAAWLAFWCAYVISGLVGRNVFIVNESLAWHALAALTAASTLPAGGQRGPR